MKLYIRQKLFSWKAKFDVTDEKGSTVYYVEGKLVSLGRKLYVYDRSREEVASIQEKLVSLLKRYEVEIAGKEAFQVVKEIRLFKPKYAINGLNWEIDGDLLEHNYKIRSGRKVIATLHKKWMTWGDCYELEIENAQDQLEALTAVLAIDCVLADEAETAAAAAQV